MSRRRVRITPPRRGDVVAGVSVALVLIPQSLAYATLAGVPAVHGLYAAVASTLAAGVIGSSPYLQTGPVALTSLLTLGALATTVEPGSADFAAHAALLALVVGAVRILLGVLRLGVVAYLMSQPVVAAFTVAAALLIVASQAPALVGTESGDTNPVIAAAQALQDAPSWNWWGIGIGLTVLAVTLLSRRIHPLLPGALIGSLAALAVSATGTVDVAVVGDIPDGLPPLSVDLPWDALGSLIVPGVVIALIGFAEPASIARRYATEDRTPWDPDREFVGQGLANVGAGLFSGYPVGGSFSRSSLNRLSGARTRWSGVMTGLVVLAVLPVVSVLSELPSAALAGLVMAAVLPLLGIRPMTRAWQVSRPQFVVTVVTFVVTVVAAPRVEWGVVVGVALALAVHLWRELHLEMKVWTDGATLHVRPQGVLYFGSAPELEARVLAVLAENREIQKVSIHLDQLGRVDLTGVLVLNSLIEDMHGADIEVRLLGAQPQARRVLDAVFEDRLPGYADMAADDDRGTEEGPDARPASEGTTPGPR